ncbi:MAG: hypothetical protein ACI8T1_000800 [Verrucomicrobiales bacterium]|jgi:hypothetical protein
MIDGQLLVGDSLRPEMIYQEPYDDFMKNHVLNVLMIEASPFRPTSNAVFRWHSQGWRSLLTTATSVLPIPMLIGVPLPLFAIWTLMLWCFAKGVS